MAHSRINPPQLFDSLQYGFSQIVTAEPGRMIHLSGQVAWGEKQQIVGEGDLGVQTTQALQNVETALAAAGGSLTDIMSMRIYFVESQLEHTAQISDALKHFFDPAHAPATTWIGVRVLARKEFLVEIEAIGVVG